MSDVWPSSSGALATLIEVLEEVARGAASTGALSAARRLPRTRVAESLALSGLLGFTAEVGAAAEAVALTDRGASFVADVAARPELMAEALSPWSPGEVAEPSEVPMAVAALMGEVEGDVDWSTGRQRQVATLGLTGPVFVGALVGHLGGARGGLEVSFPASVGALGEAASVQEALERAPDAAPARVGQRFGELWASDAIRALPEREQSVYAMASCPYLTLTVVLLWMAERRWAPDALYIARDLWGVKFWAAPDHRACGDVVEVVEGAARELGVRVIRPGREGGPDQLLELLTTLKLLKSRKTRSFLAPGLSRRMSRSGAVDALWGPPLAELLEPVERALTPFLEYACAGPAL